MGIRKCFILVVFLAVIGSIANAGESRDTRSVSSSKSDAIASFKRGVQSFDNKDFEGALAAFQKAFELNPSWKLLYNIAHCQAALKLYGLAVVTFERYLAEGGDNVPEVRRDEVLDELGRMRKMIGDIEIVAPEGVDVYVDDIHRGVTPLPAPVSVSAGRMHTIVLKENDEVLLTVEKIVRGETVSEVMYEPRKTLEEPVASSPAVDQEPPKVEMKFTAPVQTGRRKLSPAPFWVAAGTTAVLGGATVALVVLVGNGKDNQSSKADADTLNTMRKIGIGTLFGTAGAGITAAILAAFTNFRGDRLSTPPVSVYGTPSEGGLVLLGSF
ncbi:MAG: tetratricopeptide repeat protein [Deltaproteobacteria bacterium]|nr:tetratricopeptide repeat protein [Deltaproteobacteria bacterium]